MAGKDRLGDVLRVKHGFAFSGQFFKDTPPGDVLVTPGNFNVGGGFNLNKPKFYDGPEVEGYVLNTGDLIVTMTDLSKESDTLGFPALVPASNGEFRFLHNQRVGLVEVTSPCVDKRYIYYVMASPRYRAEILASATGTTVKHTSPTRIESYELDLPSPSDQRAIAATLGALDDKIDLNQKMNATLEAVARALFTSWFVDFDPVRVPAGGRAPTVSRELRNLFPKALHRSKIGDIPLKWGVGQVSDIASLQRVTVNPAGFQTERFEHYSIPAYDNAKRPVLELGCAIKSNKFAVSKAAVLVSKLNPTIERVWLVDAGRAGIPVASTEFLPLEPKPPFTRAFVYCFARSKAFRQQLAALTTGTSNSHQRANVDATMALPCLLPPPAVLAAFDRIAEPLLRRIVIADRESSTLAALRDALLPKLVSGELRVADAERPLEKSA